MAKRDSFFEAIEDGPLPPVLAFGGEERVFVDDAIAIIRRRALEGGLADFNYDRVSAKEKDASEIFCIARTLPTMSPRRLVEVQDAEELKEDAFAPVAAYLKDPSPETVLCFVFRKWDGRSKLLKLLNKEAIAAKFEHPREFEMPRVVAMRAKRRRQKLSSDAAEAIAMTVGTDLLLLENALEKLDLACAGSEITLEDISTHVADTHLEDAFALGTAVAVGDRKAALTSLRNLKAARTAPLQLTGLIAWQMRQVVRANELLEQGRDENSVGQQMRARGPRLTTLVRAGRTFSLLENEKRLARVAFIDQQLKRSRAPNWLWMERLILELCPQNARRRRRR
ncbi:MAG: DNA polymerase III subunit delta [Deltaproteobacteria bacterium]|nr:DNA polymerase III subunit delta [Deltaproteobacteria bacterium]